ncbi:phosphotransferase system (PTS) lichenan-specific enzyme IIA component [Carnobacterium sp. 17-4]|uniref:PTS lactose/cellobiose transporter subunit IIA n=1 Tax=Carnobacterium sp. (strain 17-4) TaxID=208596 RepID=UPI000205893F|nr:PTS lactose/cellobiose transporter subunit IIA [Carnobacterium sp. 17-4]AEB30600.1 phosphotransferase system (PTS) lichenan-specific enzyme IIA component [Carnobacterium sp. 17-4]
MGQAINIETIMGLIIHGGNAKSDAMEAIHAAKTDDFTLAAEKLDAADKSLVEAHHAQTSLLTQEASGEELTVSLLAVHSQDHLMNAITFRDMASEVVDVYKKLAGVSID